MLYKVRVQITYDDIIEVEADNDYDAIEEADYQVSCALDHIDNTGQNTWTRTLISKDGRIINKVISNKEYDKMRDIDYEQI